MNFIEEFLKTHKDKISKEIRVLGIDLGTTNSTVAEVVWKPSKSPACKTLEIDQPTREGIYTSPIVPSVVAILPDKKIWVGEGAKRLRAFSQDAQLSFEKNLFYETKNEMGLRKTYYRAPEDFNHASRIAGHILAFLKEGAVKTSDGEYDHLSVSVPASFQLNQRRDTLLACEYAGLGLRDDDLLDEPTAALIDYIQTEGQEKIVAPGEASLCVVLDFGGGTCDVSVVEVAQDKDAGQLTMSQLSVSRYHRLGGGDIDAAIVHECLIPQLLEENGLSLLDLTWAQKKRGLEPQLLGKAEALKIALCKEIERLKKFGKYEESDKSEIVAKQPPAVCSLGKKEYRLSRPSLSAEEFEGLLEPFLDRDLLYARETEFRLTQSVFAPLEDALNRADKEAHEIDFCLMVGGSCLIPQVQEAVEEYFEDGTVGLFKDHMAMQCAVAKGTAWNALIKAVSGRPLIEPVLHDGMALVTAKAKLNSLVPKGITLPFPADGSYMRDKLYVPKGEILGKDLRFEVVGESDKQHIFNEVWTLPEEAEPGDEITMEYRVTAGKQFECRAFLTEFPESILEKTVENPLVNVLSPHEIKVKIEKAEEELRMRGGGTAEDWRTFIDLALWYGELNQREKALDYLRMALNKIQRPHPHILHLQGLYYDELGDYERSEKAYREADKISRVNWSLFNLALGFHKRGLQEKALETIEKALQKEGEQGSCLSLKASCLESLGSAEEAQATRTEAVKAFGQLGPMDEWELGWYTQTVKELGDEKLMKKANAEWKKRHKRGREIVEDDIPRPVISSDSGKNE